VIFTESVRTQRYLAELLAANGYAGDVVLLNGQNNDPDSRAIYEDWRARHRGTDAISGSRTADMKAAIVEAFRDRKSILIATESGAEASTFSSVPSSSISTFPGTRSASSSASAAATAMVRGSTSPSSTSST